MASLLCTLVIQISKACGWAIDKKELATSLRTLEDAACNLICF